MTQTGPRWTARAFLGRAFGMIRGNLEIFLLIAALWTILSALVFMPIREDMREIMVMFEQMQQAGAPDPQQQQALGEKVLPIIDDILLIAVVTMLFSAAAYTVWGRAVGLGRGKTLGSGTGRRFLMMLWRQVSLLGYAVLIGIGTAIIGFLLLLIIGLLGGGQAIVELLVNLLTIALMIPLLVGFVISVASTAVDDGRGIMESLLSIQGRMAAPLLAGGAILIGLAIITVAMAALMTGLSAGASLSTPALLVQNALNSMLMLTFVALGRAIYEQIGNSSASGPAQT
mgnify:CR=1 FL=1